MNSTASCIFADAVYSDLETLQLFTFKVQNDYRGFLGIISWNETIQDVILNNAVDGFSVLYALLIICANFTHST